MYASATIGYTAHEIRPARTVLRQAGDGEQQTIRVRTTSRSNDRRQAIAASLGYGR